MNGLIDLLVLIIVVGIVLGLIYFLVQRLPIAEPYKGWVSIALLVLAVLIILRAALPLLGVHI